MRAIVGSMMSSFRVVAAALMLLAFSASLAEAAWMSTCERETPAGPAPAGHSHTAPADDGTAPPPSPAHECPLALTGHQGCAFVSLPSLAASGELHLHAQARERIDPAEEHGVLLARDRFHPPRRTLPS